MNKYTILLLTAMTFICFSCKKENNTPSIEPTHSHISYGVESRQWLNLYLADSETPTPIYIFAHSNGGTADNVQDFVTDLKGAGVSTISWESVETISTITDTETAWADAALMFDWVKTNAATYNLDTNNIIIGGRSRGSGANWKLAHSLDPGIKGIYMFQALPDGFWEYPETWDPKLDISVDAPPLKFTYKPEPGANDIHDPENGFMIMDRYTELGIGEKASMEHTLGSDEALYSDIVEWCLLHLD